MGDMSHIPPESTLELGLDIDVPDPERFSMEHWLYLTRAFGDDVPEAPHELAPYPALLTTDAVLRRQLQEWGCIDNTGHVTPETSELLNAVVNAPVKLWGQVRFPENTHTRSIEVPEDAKDWGIPSTTEVTPRVPFLVSRIGDVMLLCTSTPQGVTIAARATSAEPTADLAAGMWEIIDPDKAWPAARDLAVVPAALVDKVTADDSLGRYGQCPDEDEARSRVGALVQEAGASSDCVPVLTKLVTEKTAAIAQAVVSLTTSGSGVTHRFDNDAVAVVMLQGKNPSAYVVSPDRSNGQDVVAYEPGDVSHLKKGVERLVSKANRSLRSSKS